MKILVTGAKGFIGKNLIAELKNRKYTEIFEYDRDSDHSLLEVFCKEADFVFHLAGVNRPKEQSEFMEGNFGFTSELLTTLKKHKNTCPVMISSSIQAELDNPYGESKKQERTFCFLIAKKQALKFLFIDFLMCLVNGADLIITAQ
ncbi:UDP-2-acetamido-2,6-beta-L-arabino-hexul-4-ose reductase [Proteiniclasticum ruminis]|uniref:UDP-2-acetamido-2,6-beta-L-arabino-hexul-4-ose reductase n=1 Tax=Proteiniclasticum ruminis TaxID=398199 RepID=A0A1G8SCA0_9CLOT|nr:UDP-2-acetamido-2,6-beta-L-arabino-hexul-4-ose reductase [Proteiniclasticum ruminis]